MVDASQGEEEDVLAGWDGAACALTERDGGLETVGVLGVAACSGPAYSHTLGTIYNCISYLLRGSD